jgi:hypothetical protein
MKTQKSNQQRPLGVNEKPSMSYCDEGGIKTTKITRYVSSDELVAIIQSEQLKQRTQEFYDSNSEEHQLKIKHSMPYIIVGGTFKEKRSADNLIERSGFIGLDFDKVEHIEKQLIQLKQDPLVHIAKTSISNKGLHIIVKVDTLVANHKTFFQSLALYFEETHRLKIDKAVSNVASTLILSYSDQLIHRPDSIRVGIDFLERFKVNARSIKAVKLESTSKLSVNLTQTNRAYYGKTKLKWASENIKTCEDGSKHMTLLKTATALGTYVAYEIIELSAATKTLQEAIEVRSASVMDMQKAYKTIEDGLKYGMQKPFDILEEVVPEDRKWWNVIEKKNNKQIALSYVDTYNFFAKSGYFIMQRGASEIFIEVKDNVIEEVTETTLIQHLSIDIDSLPFFIGDGFTKTNLRTVFLDAISSIFNQRRLKSWKMYVPNLIRDTKDQSYFFFKNGFVEVSKKGKTIRPYSALSGQIWRSQIIDRNLDLLKKDSSSQFAEFLHRVGECNPTRFKGLRSLIAYTMHGYKDPVEPRATLFVDEFISEHPNGGTGKGLVINAISQLREVTILDGKSFKFDRFAYQRVTQQTQILVFEDITAQFKFEKLFAIMSNGLTVEKKNEHEFFISREEAPKILLTSNYAVGGEGNSNKRRQYLIEFSQHYNGKNPPIKEFKQRFFEDWDQPEWNRFDNFMMDCVEEYFNEGVVLPPSINVDKKKLMQVSNKAFMEFAFNEISFGVKYDRDTLIEKFNDQYGGQIVDSPGGVRKFNEWVDSFVGIMDWHLEKSRGASNTHKYTFYESMESSLKAQEFIQAKIEKEQRENRDVRDSSAPVLHGRAKRRMTNALKERIGKLGDSDMQRN